MVGPRGGLVVYADPPCITPELPCGLYCIGMPGNTSVCVCVCSIALMGVLLLLLCSLLAVCSGGVFNTTMESRRRQRSTGAATRVLGRWEADCQRFDAITESKSSLGPRLLIPCVGTKCSFDTTLIYGLVSRVRTHSTYGSLVYPSAAPLHQRGVCYS